MTQPSLVASQQSRSDGTTAYCILACLITWLLAAPAALAWIRQETPASFAIACAGLSAFGPLLAALLIAAPRGELGDVFGRWRTRPVWIVFGLLAPLASHLLAGMFAAAIGAKPDHWTHPPVTPEHIAALVVFPLGEEFGWRGFAQPRMTARYGQLIGSLLVGLVWGLWHLAYSITPERAGFDLFVFMMMLIKLPLWSVIIGWAFERANRSLAVAIAFHAGGHIDNLQRAANADMLHAAHIVVLAIAAFFAASAMRRSARPAGVEQA
jgi:membrane protease YdiL (CAAX protease family)